MKTDLNKLRQSKEYQDFKKTWTPIPRVDEANKSEVDPTGYDLKEAKDKIVNELQDHFYDIIFQAVADQMNKNYLFQQSNYFTEAGEEEFEEAWFEWYHNHHGDILYRVLQTLEP